MNSSALPYLYQEELYQVTGKILVVLARPWEQYTEEEKVLLSRILSSVKLNTAAAHIIVQNTLSLASLRTYNISRVLVFGASADITAYQAVQVQGFSVIRADDLSHLDDQKKKNLWMALKTMFGL